MSNFPSFDDWFRKKHMGFSFDAYYLKADDDFTAGLKALTREMRDYVTDMAQEILQKDSKKEQQDDNGKRYRK